MHRLAASFAPPGDVGDSAEGGLIVIERVLSVSRSLVRENECIWLKFGDIGIGVDGME